VTGLIRVAVVYGGPSEEHAVSRASAAGVLRHLDPERFRPVPFYVTQAGHWALAGDPGDRHDDSLPTCLSRALTALRACDVAFPVMHGRYGEDGVLQSLLELIGLPYVGSGVMASAVGMDKTLTKQLLAAAGLVVADSVMVTADTTNLPEADRERLGLPAFVKPARSGSSIGVSRVDDWLELGEAMALAAKCDDRILVEAAVPGREVDVAVVEYPDGRVVAGPPLEIVVAPGRRFFDHEAKYADRNTVFRVPALNDAATTAMLQAQAVRVFHELGCRGQLRVDFFLRPDGIAVVNEVNTVPGLTAESQVPRIWAAAGLEYRALLTVLLETALVDRQPHPTGVGQESAARSCRLAGEGKEADAAVE
jgi:D-alanine-D-alanine ligase